MSTEVEFQDDGVESGLERLMGTGQRFLDFKAWSIRGEQLGRSVCLIRFGDAPQGTGFLIAPDLVMTCRHVVAPILAGSESVSNLQFVFDYVSDASSPPVSLNVNASAWCMADSPENELDFAVLRLDRALDRDAIDLSRVPHDFTKGSGLVMIQHPSGNPQKLAVSSHSGKLSPDASRVLHAIDTLAGSSGAPIFDMATWTLVALHQGWEGNRNKAVPIAPIAAQAKVQEERIASLTRATKTTRSPAIAAVGVPGAVARPAPPRTRLLLLVSVVALVLVAGGASAWYWMHRQITLRLRFYNGPTSLQPITGQLDVYFGTSVVHEPLSSATSVAIESSATYLDTRLRVDLSGEFEIDPTAPAPVITADSPIAVRVRRRQESLSCRDAVFDLSVTDLDTAEVGGDRNQLDLAVRLRIVSQTSHPIYLDRPRVAIMHHGVPFHTYDFSFGDDARLPPRVGVDRIVNGQIAKGDYDLLTAGLELGVSAHCQDPDHPEDAGPEITSLPWERPPARRPQRDAKPKPPANPPTSPLNALCAVAADTGTVKACDLFRCPDECWEIADELYKSRVTAPTGYTCTTMCQCYTAPPCTSPRRLPHL